MFQDVSRGRARHRSNRQAGVALVTVVLFSVLAIGLVAIALVVSGRQSREVAERGAAMRLRRVAESAIRLKTVEMDLARKSGISTPAGGLAVALTIAAEGVQATATPVPATAGPNRYVVDVRAQTTDGYAQSLHLAGRVEEFQPVTPLLNHAIFANGNLTVQGPVVTQSYDGTAGFASGSNVGAEGNIGANGQVTISDAESDVGGAVYHPVGQAPNIAPGATVGSDQPLDQPIAFPDLIGTTVQDALANTTQNAPITIDGAAASPAVGANLTVDQGQTLVMGPGRIVLGNLKLKRGAELRFEGDVELIVQELKVDTNSQINVSNQTVKVYYQTEFKIENGTAVSIAADGQGEVLAQRFQAYGLPGSTLQIEEAEVMGVFYAPEGNATIDSTATLQGTLIGQDVTIRSEGGSGGGSTGPDLGLPGGHFDVDVWYRRADGTFTATQEDYHEHQYDDNHNTDSFVFQGSATNGITGLPQGAEAQAFWSELVAARGAQTQVELVLSNPGHASGAYRVQLQDGTTLSGDARNGASGVTFQLGQVTDFSVQIASLYELLGTEPGLVQNDPIARGTENVPIDPTNPQTGAYGVQLYVTNPDGTRGALLYEFRTYFHNKTGQPWPPQTTTPPDGTDPPPPSVPNATTLRFDTSLRGLFQIPTGTPGYRLREIWELPLTTDVPAAIQ